MSYLVPRKIPKCCGQCPFQRWSQIYDGKHWCALDETNSRKYAGLFEKLDNCPLIELPPHGRLGDLDALYAEISNGNKAYNGFDGYDGKYPNIANVDDCLDAIKYADTVIEAEGET